MNQEILQTIANFLNRAELRGSEVPAFNACMEALQGEFEKLAAPAPEEAPSEA